MKERREKDEYNFVIYIYFLDDNDFWMSEFYFYLKNLNEDVFVFSSSLRNSIVSCMVRTTLLNVQLWPN